MAADVAVERIIWRTAEEGDAVGSIIEGASSRRPAMDTGSAGGFIDVVKGKVSRREWRGERESMSSSREESRGGS